MKNALVLAAALIIGCGSDKQPSMASGGSGGGGGETMQQVCPATGCQHSKYVLSSITLPANMQDAVSKYGCVYGAPSMKNGPKNKLGTLFATLRATGIDIDGAVAMAFQAGQLVLLFDVGYTESLTSSKIAQIAAEFGTHDASDGLMAPAFYQGKGKFTVTMQATPVGGTITNGTASFGPGTVGIEFPLLAGTPPIKTALIGTRLKGAITATSLDSTVVCGGLPLKDLTTTVLPGVASYLSAKYKETKGGGLYATIDTDHSCPNDTACNSPTAPGTCSCITVQDLLSNPLVSGFLKPDVDLDGTANPNDAKDPNESLSFGIGIAANAASF
jgi:hypothetical protein